MSLEMDLPRKCLYLAVQSRSSCKEAELLTFEFQAGFLVYHRTSTQVVQLVW